MVYWQKFNPEEFEFEYAAFVPARISGAEFLKVYGGITDRVTEVDPARDYPVLAATRHPVYENARVKSFAEILRGGQAVDQTRVLGDLMYQSHESYSQCGLGSDGTDRIVELVQRSAGEDLYGAKITGGGSGGTVAVLSECDAAASIARIADRYSQLTGYRPYVFTGSSPGSVAFGHLKLVVN